MRAIILAAGVGSRLQPVTNKKPKTLINVVDKPILGHIIDSLVANSILEIVVCVGFKAKKVINFCENTYPNVSFFFVHNKKYDSTNNMYSLYLAKKYLDQDIILMNADLVFDKDIINGLLKQTSSAVAVDVGRYIEESMKIVLGSDGNIKGISKEIAKKEAYGCSIDIYKVDRQDCKLLNTEMERIIEENKDLNQWTERMLDNLFRTGKIVTKPYGIESKRWVEIDDYSDLALAEMLFNDKLSKLKGKKIFFIDRDGTLALGDSVLPGAINFLRKLKENRKTFYILTNNSSRTPAQHLENFNQLGLEVELDNVLVSSQPLVDYLKQKEMKRVFWVANNEVGGYFQEEGLVLDEDKPQAIVLTFDNEITYQKMEKLAHLVRAGIPYYATHCDIVCPTQHGPVPDIGTFIKVIEMTTGITPKKIFGKPHMGFVESVLKKHVLHPREAVVIGDRLYTDIKMAQDSEVTSVLVLSGETKREDYEESEIKSDIVISSVEELIDHLG